MLRRIGTQKQSKMVAMEIGSITILTGLYLVIVIGELRCQFGAAKTNTRCALNH